MNADFHDNMRQFKQVSLGVNSNCDTCAYDFGYELPEESNNFIQDCNSGDLTDEGCFSYYSCCLCNDSLGGLRYLAHGIDKRNEIVHMDICENCLHRIKALT